MTNLSKDGWITEERVVEVFISQVYHKEDLQWLGCWVPVTIRSLTEERLVVVDMTNNQDEVGEMIVTDLVVEYLFWPGIYSHLSLQIDYIRPRGFLPDQRPSKNRLMQADFFEIWVQGVEQQNQSWKTTKTTWMWMVVTPLLTPTTEEDKIVVKTLCSYQVMVVPLDSCRYCGVEEQNRFRTLYTNTVGSSVKVLECWVCGEKCETHKEVFWMQCCANRCFKYACVSCVLEDDELDEDKLIMLKKLKQNDSTFCSTPCALTKTETILPSLDDLLKQSFNYWTK